MFYKNISYSVKTFHGVIFNPNEIKEVKQAINSKFMILVDPPKIKKVEIEAERAQEQQKPSPGDKAKKEALKAKKSSEESKEDPIQSEEILEENKETEEPKA